MTTVNARRTGGSDGPEVTPRRLTPDDAVPRLVRLGMDPEHAERLVEAHGDLPVLDALDGLDELDVDRKVVDPVGWVRAAVTRRWDLDGLLADCRRREARGAEVDGQRRRVERERESYEQRMAVADRWTDAISAALDDRRLAQAVEQVTSPLDVLGRRSVPVARAELLAWALEVHDRHPTRPLAAALAADLDAGAQPVASLPDGPLPDPPDPPEASDAQVGESLEDRISRLLATRTLRPAQPTPSELSHLAEPSAAQGGPDRPVEVELARELER